MGLSAESMKILNDRMDEVNPSLTTFKDTMSKVATNKDVFKDMNSGDILIYQELVKGVSDGWITNEKTLDNYLEKYKRTSGKSIELTQDQIDILLENSNTMGMVIKNIDKTSDSYDNVSDKSATASNLMEKATTKIKSNVENLDTLEGTAKESASKTATGYADTLLNDTKKRKRDYEEVGQYPYQNMITGMKKQEKPVTDEASSISKSVTDVTDKKLNKDIFDDIGYSAFGGLLSGIKSMASNIFTFIGDFLDNIIQSFSNIGDYIYNSISNWSSSLSSFSFFDNNTYSKTGTTKRYRGYASGQVIPPNMAAHLAILGDNNNETEVVSPLSTMKQAMIEALQEGNYGGNNGDIVIQIDGTEIFRVVRKQANIFNRQTGISAFS